ncbi:MAG: class I SAM-dependent methyltransferase [Saprospiraceae bacterium]|nr:class I SAM-dependent methyltransferase [Saprospiraceae bacterium]
MDYLSLNKSCWNERTDVHFQSKTYDVENFIQGGNALNSIELELLGDIKGKKVLHLQCHFGKDTISLSRLGAEATGIDFSENAIARAQELAQQTQSNTRFILSDVYGLPAVLEEKFDIVFTSYGTIGWLPDVKQWAEVVSHFLKPGGEFIFAEFHPVVWMMSDDFSKIQYRYFTDEAIVEESDTTYTDGQLSKSMKSVGWNHGLAEVVQALLDTGLRLDSLEEFDYSPYDCFDKVVEVETGKYQIQGLEGKIPMVYALKATQE